MKKIWLKNYPSGVPAEINPDAYQSLVEMFEESVQQFKNLPAFYSLGTTLTFQQVDKYSREFAAYLQNILLLKKGERVGIMLPNILQYPIAMFGILRAGLVVVNINPLYTPSELINQLKDSGTETIVVLANFAETIQQTLSEISYKNIIITQVGDLLSQPKAFFLNFYLKYIQKKIPHFTAPNVIPFKKVLLLGKNQTLKPVKINSHDVAFLQYTGGTTGVAKGAMLTHRNLLANIVQAVAWFDSLLESKKEIVVTALPLYHIFSLTANCLFIFKLGGLNVLISNPRDIPHLISEMSKFKFTTLTGVNTLFSALLKSPQFEKLDFSGFKMCLGGGMAVQHLVAEKWAKITGIPILEAYGLTETSPCVTMNPASLKEFNGTIGLPVSSTDVCILDDHGKEVPLGQPGELAVKGPQVMYGYWRNPAETHKVFTKNGWLLTGDIASIDNEGFLRLHERKKDMILVSGFNVYPNEIEDVLVRLPGVREAAVIGIADRNSGETVRAFIVKEDPNLTKQEVLNYCAKHLTGYKVPKDIEFCEDLPKSNVGKILRRVLKEKVNMP